MILPLKTYFHLHFFQHHTFPCILTIIDVQVWMLCFPHLTISAGGDTLIPARCSELMMSFSARPISRSWAGSQALRTGSSSSSSSSCSSTHLLCSCSSCSLRWRPHISFWRSTTQIRQRVQTEFDFMLTVRHYAHISVMIIYFCSPEGSVFPLTVALVFEPGSEFCLIPDRHSIHHFACLTKIKIY